MFNRRVWPFRFGSRIGEPSGKSSANLTPFFTLRAPSACPALIPSHPLRSRRLPFLIRVVGGQDPFGGQPRLPRGTQVGTLHPNSPVHSNTTFTFYNCLFFLWFHSHLEFQANLYPISKIKSFQLNSKKDLGFFRNTNDFRLTLCAFCVTRFARTFLSCNLLQIWSTRIKCL